MRFPAAPQPALGHRTSLIVDDVDLYQGFDNLRMARNQFCHQAVARDHLGPVTLPRAGELLAVAERGLAWLEERLPMVQRRPIASVVITTAITQPLYRVPG